jgi:hypothetical protein
MNQLSPEDTEYLLALAEGRGSWDRWSLWLAINARRLASLLPRDHMRRLRDEPAVFIPVLLAECGVPCRPPAIGGRLDEWVVAICEVPSSLSALSRLREPLGLTVSALADVRRLLPGVYRRGPRDEVASLAGRLVQQGLRATAFPAWQLDGPPGDDGQDPIADEEYEVYTAVGHTDLLRFELPDLTFGDLVGDDPMCREPLRERFRGLFRARLIRHPEVLDDYERRNAVGGRLWKRFRTRGDYQLLSERRQADLCWEGGMASLSRAGFGRDGTLALVSLRYYGGPLCGFGAFLVLDRADIGWQLAEHFTAWVS